MTKKIFIALLIKEFLNSGKSYLIKDNKDINLRSYQEGILFNDYCEISLKNILYIYINIYIYNIMFKNKYLKYKEKYLDLKNILIQKGGSQFGQESINKFSSIAKPVKSYVQQSQEFGQESINKFSSIAKPVKSYVQQFQEFGQESINKSSSIKPYIQQFQVVKPQKKAVPIAIVNTPEDEEGWEPQLNREECIISPIIQGKMPILFSSHEMMKFNKKVIVNANANVTSAPVQVGEENVFIYGSSDGHLNFCIGTCENTNDIDCEYMIKKSVSKHAYPVITVAIQKYNNKHYIASCDDKGVIKIWIPRTDLQGICNYDCIQTLQSLRDQHHIQKMSLVFEEGREQGIISAVSGVSRVYDSQTQIQYGIKIWRRNSDSIYKLFQELRGHTSYVNSVVFEKNDNLIISGSDDRTVKIWFLKSDGRYECIQTLTGHTGPVNSVSVKRNSKKFYIISGSNDTTIKIWKVTGRNESIVCNLYQTLTGHKKSVELVAIQPTSNFVNNDDVGWNIISGSDDATIIIWHPNSDDKYECIRRVTIGILNSVSFFLIDRYYQPNDLRILLNKSGNITLLNISIIDPYQILENNGSIYNNIAIGNGTIVSTIENGSFHIWRLNNKNEYEFSHSSNLLEPLSQYYAGSTRKILSVAIQRSSQHLIVLGGSISMFRWQDGPIYIARPNLDGIYGPIELLSNNEDGVISSVAIEEGIQVRGEIIVGAVSKRIYIWRPNNNGKYEFFHSLGNLYYNGTEPTAEERIETHDETYVNSVAIESNGRRGIVSGGEDGTIKIWRPNSDGRYKFFQTFGVQKNYYYEPHIKETDYKEKNIYREDNTQNPVTKVITDGNYIVWCSKKDSIKILKLDERTNKYELLQTLENTIGEKRVAINKNTIISGSPGESNSIKVWRLDTLLNSSNKFTYTKTLKIIDDMVVNLEIEGIHIISRTSSGRIIIHNLDQILETKEC